jgi:hypothetical protein
MPGIINNPELAMYVAAAVALVVMVGFFVYLWRLDSSVRELQRTLELQSGDVRQSTGRVVKMGEGEPLRPQRIEKELSDGLNRG